MKCSFRILHHEIKRQFFDNMSTFLKRGFPLVHFKLKMVITGVRRITVFFVLENFEKKHFCRNSEKVFQIYFTK